MSTHNKDRESGAAALPPVSRWVFAVVALKIAIQVLTHAGYGIFRDELYFVACARHLSWSFVDHPPLAPLLLSLFITPFGDSLFVIRLWPALAGGATVLMGALLARELGGKAFSQILTALCLSLGTGWLLISHTFNIVCFEPVYWSALALVTVRMIRERKPRLWLVFGLLGGLAVLNKTSAVVFCFGVVVGLLLTRQRRLLWTPWIVAGGAVALLLNVPAIWWQAMHGFPQAEFVRNATSFKNIALSPLEFFTQEILIGGPPTMIVWLAGLVFFALLRGGRFRFAFYGWVVCFAIFVTMHGKAYYLAAAMPLMMAGGAVIWEQMLSGPRWQWTRPVLAGLIVLLLIPLAPAVLPIAAPQHFVAYQKILGVEPSAGEHHKQGMLPQMYADMFGWREMTEEVARVYNSLTPAERAHAGIYGQNYGEAGAIDYFGRRHGLPPAMSGHNSYFIWGPGDREIESLIVIGGDRPDSFFEEVQAAGKIHHPYAMPYENNLTVWLCRRPKTPLKEAWPKVKHYD